MSLSDNTTALQSLLAAVEELPSQSAVKLQEKSVEPTTSVQTVVPDSGYDGLSKVTVGAASGGTNVQIKTGSITTGTDGTATVSCGFKPDLVVFFISNFTVDGDAYENVVCLPIAASKSSNGANLSTAAYADTTLVAYIDCWIESITSTGVKVCFYKNAQSGAGYVSRKTYNWTAVKYTA